MVISVCCVLLMSLPALAQQQFSPSQLKEDLLYYKTKLEQLHPNLYLYSSREKFRHFFDSLSHSVNSSLNEFEFYKLITLTSSIVKDGHTLILPSNSFTAYHNANSKFLPFQVGLFQGNLYVKMNCTNSKLIEDGTIIDSINGTPANFITENLLNRQVRDGENSSYANWILDSYFREYYSYVFGHPNTFRISCKIDNRSTVILANALTKDSIYYYRQKNYMQFYSDSNINKGIYANYILPKHIVVLTIKDFHSEVLKNEYNQNFSAEIEKIIDDIIQNQVPNLVIDLRNNQGGDVENGVILLKYLISRPFKIVNGYQKLKNGNIIQGKGPSMGLHKPNKKRYHGQIYVLLNGGSFSNSVIFSSCLREYTNTIFVGTESGGNPNVLAGYAREFKLPNTKINVQVPTKRFVITSMTKNNGTGLIPTYKVEHTIENNIHLYDNQLNFLLNLIK